MKDPYRPPSSLGDTSALPTGFEEVFLTIAGLAFPLTVVVLYWLDPEDLGQIFWLLLLLALVGSVPLVVLGWRLLRWVERFLRT